MAVSSFRFRFFAFVFIVLVGSVDFLGSGADVFGQSVSASDEWPMFRHDLQRTGTSTSNVPDASEVKWFYNASTEIDSSPAVVNGRVTVGVSDGTILALNATTGERLWLNDTGAGSNSIWGSPAVDSGRVYIGTRNNNLYCLDESTGAFLWTFLADGEIDSSPAVKDGRVFFGAGNLYCLTVADGSLVWSFDPEGRIYSSPALWNGTVFIGTSYSGNVSARLCAVDEFTGALLWAYEVDSPVSSSPAVVDGKVFFASSYRVYCLDADAGTLVWNTPGELSVVRSSPAVANGKVFIGGADGKFYCFDVATGLSLWNVTDIAPIWSSPAVADGKVVFGTERGKVYCLNESTGSEVWSFQALERVASSPAISDGTVFVGCGSAFLKIGGVYALGPKYSLQSSLSLSLDSQAALLGFKVKLSGQLESDDAPIAGVPVLLSFSVTGGQTWNDITAVPTSADGSYSAVWQPSATGTYLVKATWTPYYPYEAAESTRMLSVNTFDDQTVFAVVSNSTVPALAFNSTSKELSFTVSGPTGTIGFVDLTIATPLVAKITDLKVYLDGVSLNYTATEITESWQLHFTYTHSTHNISINLPDTMPTSPTQPPTTPTIELIIPATIIAIAIAAGLLLIFKRKRKS